MGDDYQIKTRLKLIFPLHSKNVIIFFLTIFKITKICKLFCMKSSKHFHLKYLHGYTRFENGKKDTIRLFSLKLKNDQRKATY